VSLDVDSATQQIEKQLRALGTPERAAGEKRYLKSDLEHFGTTLPEIRRATRQFARQHPDLTHDELVALTGTLWTVAVFEDRMAAVILLEGHPSLLGPADLPLIKELVGTSHTWGLVDPLAANVVGSIVSRAPGAAGRLDRWARDDDFWIRRAAILSTMKTRDFERFSRYADPMLEETEFFIRKAIGWVLREVSKHDPDRVFEWLDGGLADGRARITRASGVTVREAVKYLAPAQREQLLLKRRRRPQRASERT
jgi:3-methyladenine DNA glycosylase AlkD